MAKKNLTVVTPLTMLREIAMGVRARAEKKSNRGRSYVVFGRSSFTSPLDLSDLSGSTGLIFNGETDNNNTAAWSVAGVGDVNADDLDHVIVAAAPGAFADRPMTASNL